MGQCCLCPPAQACCASVCRFRAREDQGGRLVKARGGGPKVLGAVKAFVYFHENISLACLALYGSSSGWHRAWHIVGAHYLTAGWLAGWVGAWMDGWVGR